VENGNIVEFSQKTSLLVNQIYFEINLKQNWLG